MLPDEAVIHDFMRECRAALRFVEGVSWDQFRADLRTQKAVLHCLMIMGEAVKRQSPELRQQHADIAWSDIAGMRDVLIHAYHRVELSQVWNVLQTDLPAIAAYVETSITFTTPDERGAY